MYLVNMSSAGVVWISSLTIPETFAPMFLRSRDQAMRTETGDNSDITRQERFRKPLNDIVSLVPPTMGSILVYSYDSDHVIDTAVTEKLASEPILLLMSMYISLVCGLLCAVFFSFPVVIGDRYGWDHTNIGITFCSVLIWVAPALRITARLEAINASKGSEVTREERLPGMLLGGPFVPLSLFIFGWTSPPYDPPQGAWGLGPSQHRPPFRIRDGPRLLLGQRVPHRGVLTNRHPLGTWRGDGDVYHLYVPHMSNPGGAAGGGGGKAASLLSGVALMMAIPFCVAPLCGAKTGEFQAGSLPFM
ncbi:LOW QUALITY PROTEIN: hypothetical protein JCM24511_05278 [Saitozyma sp. JCM 24511]|nr:LOW QUALITY PROTEIN: hypothetical protein JCM24511_05278 [Saitozyma sp. JCM 24511]